MSFDLFPGMANDAAFGTLGKLYHIHKYCENPINLTCTQKKSLKYGVIDCLQ